MQRRCRPVPTKQQCGIIASSWDLMSTMPSAASCREAHVRLSVQPATSLHLTTGRHPQRHRHHTPRLRSEDLRVPGSHEMDIRGEKHNNRDE